MKNGLMEAVTKKWLPDCMIAQMVQAALHLSTPLKAVKKLSGGFCSAVYLIEADFHKLVLKVASDPAVKVMRHEKKYVPVEAVMMRKLNHETDILMPELIYYDDSLTICPVPYFFMSYIDGTPLSENRGLPEQQVNQIKQQVGMITREISSLEAEVYGIPEIPESYCKRNSEFVYLLFDWLLLDAQEKDILIPGIGVDDLRALVRKYAAQLDQAEGPKYIHTDTWDGNIMVKNGEFAGLVDYAAILYGDPLMNHDFHDFGDSPNAYFLKGYGKEVFTEDEKIRIQIYRIWQRLGMVVERGYREYEDKNMYAWVLDEFVKEVRILIEME